MLNRAGTLNIKSVEALHKKLLDLRLWEYEKFTIDLSNMESIQLVIDALSNFDKDSKLSYRPSTIFDLDIRGLSTGEKQFLKIFSRFNAYNLNNKSKYFREKHLIILIDEFDVGFHPLWQRKFLNTWIKFLEKFINQPQGRKIKVQLILTSHSPFVVSDLPKQCINFISKGEKDNMSIVDDRETHHLTFGANIHELYSDSFFLNGALMGDFAKTKIDSIFRLLLGQTVLEDSRSISSQIDMIGDPIIKTKLIEMYAEKTGENVEIARLKLQQEYIIRRLKDIEDNDSD